MYAIAAGGSTRFNNNGLGNAMMPNMNEPRSEKREIQSAQLQGC